MLVGIVFDPKARERPLIVHEDSHSPRAENFRTLRTNLQFLDAGRRERAFVLTSPMAGEGKSNAETCNILKKAQRSYPAVEKHYDVF